MYRYHNDGELREVDLLSREELVAVLGDFKDCTRTRFTREWLDRQSTERLRLLVLAVQLYRALVHQARMRGSAKGPAPGDRPPV
jgi:hypothetical protein